MASTRIITAPRQLACCESFFKCNETLPGDGTGSIICSVTGAEFNPAGQHGSVAPSSFSLNNHAGISQAIYPECVDMIQLSSGNFPNFKQRHVIIFGCGRVVDPTIARIPYGGSVGGAVGAITHTFNGGYHGFAECGGVQFASTTGGGGTSRVCPAAGTDVGMILEYSPGASFTIKTVDFLGNTFGSGSTETLMSGTILATGDLNTSLTNTTRFSGLAFYSIMAFSFDTGLPANRDEVYKWMMYNHSAGNRALPHHWIDELSSR